MLEQGSGQETRDDALLEGEIQVEVARHALQKTGGDELDLMRFALENTLAAARPLKDGPTYRQDGVAIRIGYGKTDLQSTLEEHGLIESDESVELAAKALANKIKENPHHGVEFRWF